MSSHTQVQLPGRPADTTKPPTSSSPNSSPFSSTPYHSDPKFHLLLAASGSVATIKIPVILNALSKHADQISTRLILTKPASQFLQGQSAEQPRLDAIRKIPGVDAIYTDEDEWAHPWTRTATESVPILHIELRKWADLMVIAPLSANTLAKITNGISDGLLTSVVRAWDTDAFVDGIRPMLRGFHERRREKQTKESERQTREEDATETRQVTLGGEGKPWTSTYGFYSNEQGSRVMEENPELRFGQLTKVLHERFRALSNEEWKRYEEMAENDRMRWEDEKARKAPEVYGGAVKPWRPAYGFYVDDQHDKVEEENPGLSFSALGKLLFARWKELARGQKMPYEKSSMGDKERYEREKKEKDQALDKLEGRDPWRRGRPAYIFFANALRDTVKQETPDAGFGILGKLLRERWLALSDDQKKPYEKMAEADKKHHEGTEKAKKIIVCPAMNTAMWRQPITMKQINVLQEEWGGKEGWFEVLTPGSKTLACGDSGMGAMAKWEEIVGVVKERACLED